MDRWICLKNGCEWLTGEVCSRRCPYIRRAAGNMPLPVLPPPPEDTESAGWLRWFRNGWSGLRRVYRRKG